MGDASLLDQFLSWFDGKGFATNLISEFVLLLIAGAFYWFIRKLSLWFTVPSLWKAYGATIVCLGALYLAPVEPSALRVFAFLTTTAILLFILRTIFKGYEDIGLGAAFARTQHGVSFDQSLKIADGPLDFLGIGGDKLTKTGEFERAMIRCASSGRAVRMLLSPPDHPLLEMLAKRNGVNTNEYSKNVRESLGRIAKVKTERALDIQVRFYPLRENKDLQIFRLMFLNHKICLWSWTVWGPHLGADNPQVVLLSRDRTNQTSAYNAFHDYFKRLWEDPSCKHVDLAEYLSRP